MSNYRAKTFRWGLRWLGFISTSVGVKGTSHVLGHDYQIRPTVFLVGPLDEKGNVAAGTWEVFASEENPGGWITNSQTIKEAKEAALKRASAMAEESGLQLRPDIW